MTPEDTPESAAVRATLRSYAAAGGDLDSDGDAERAEDASTTDRRTLVADAERALRSVDRAAAFVDDGGVTRLRGVATSGEHTRLSRRANAVLQTLDDYRSAYRRASTTRPTDAGDHFHSTHDSHIPSDEVRDDN